MSLEHFKEEIRARLSLQELAGCYGRRSTCPHSDCDATALGQADCVVGDTGFYCFRCKRGGDLFGWKMASESITYAEAFKLLASKVGLSLKPNRERTKLLQEVVNGLSTYLRKTKSAKMDYLLGRGINKSLIFRYQLGYLDIEGEALDSLDLTTENLMALGLLFPGRYTHQPAVSALAGRYIFPIRDAYNNVVQLKGRADPAVHDKEIQKSLPLMKRPNSAPLAWGSCSHMDYLYLEEEIARSGNQMFICEGEPDTLTLRALGLPAVGLQTNTGIHKHANKLRGYRALYVVLDNDASSNRVRLNELYELQLKLPSTTVYSVELPALAGPDVKVDVNDFIVKYGKVKTDIQKLAVQSESADVILARHWGQHVIQPEIMQRLSKLVLSATPERKEALINNISLASGRRKDLISFALDPESFSE